MKFIIDESVEYSVVLFFKNSGFDTISIAEDFPSLEDASILSIAYREKRILVTNDKDFGELLYRLNLPHRGIIFLRLRKEDGESKIKRLKILLEKYGNKLHDSFVVITQNKVRLKKRI